MFWQYRSPTFWQIVLETIERKKKKGKKKKGTGEKIQLFWQRRKSFHSIFTYCRCSPLLLNDGGWDAAATCGLILHLLHSSVPLLSYANGKHLCRSWRQREILLLLLLQPEDTSLSRPNARCAGAPRTASAKSTLRRDGGRGEGGGGVARRRFSRPERDKKSGKVAPELWPRAGGQRSNWIITKCSQFKDPIFDLISELQFLPKKKILYFT